MLEQTVVIPPTVCKSDLLQDNSLSITESSGSRHFSTNKQEKSQNVSRL